MPSERGPLSLQTNPDSESKRGTCSDLLENQNKTASRLSCLAVTMTWFSESYGDRNSISNPLFSRYTGLEGIFSGSAFYRLWSSWKRRWNEVRREKGMNRVLFPVPLDAHLFLYAFYVCLTVLSSPPLCFSLLVFSVFLLLLQRTSSTTSLFMEEGT